jgi:hypothetical protein
MEIVGGDRRFETPFYLDDKRALREQRRFPDLRGTGAACDRACSGQQKADYRHCPHADLEDADEAFQLSQMARQRYNPRVGVNCQMPRGPLPCRASCAPN